MSRDDDHFWQSRLAARAVIDPERFARLSANGLTNHSLAEVQAAADEWMESHNEYVPAYRDLWDAIESLVPRDEQYIGWECHAPEPAATLLKLHAKIIDETPAMSPTHIADDRMRHYSGERFPITRWASCARKFRKATKAIRKSLESLTAVSVVPGK